MARPVHWYRNRETTETNWKDSMTVYSRRTRPSFPAIRKTLKLRMPSVQNFLSLSRIESPKSRTKWRVWLPRECNK